MIINAKDRPIHSPALLDMSGALLNLFRPITYQKVVQTVENFLAKETLVPYSFQGVLQPMRERAIQMKPEGQRSWRWFTLHTQTGLPLVADSIIWIEDIAYRVMEIWQWDSFNFFEYHLKQDYQNRPTTPPVPDTSLEKYLHTFTVLAPATITLDVSASLSDARKAIWKLKDSTGEEIVGVVTPTDAVTISIEVPASGTFTVIGEA